MSKEINNNYELINPFTNGKKVNSIKSTSKEPSILTTTKDNALISTVTPKMNDIKNYTNKKPTQQGNSVRTTTTQTPQNNFKQSKMIALKEINKKTIETNFSRIQQPVPITTTNNMLNQLNSKNPQLQGIKIKNFNEIIKQEIRPASKGANSDRLSVNFKKKI